MELGNGFLCLFPWEPTEVVKETVLCSRSLPLGLLDRIWHGYSTVPYPHHLHNHATRRSISASYVSRAAEPALHAPTRASGQ